MYEPNPSPDQAEAFQPIGGKPLALYARDAAFLAKKGQAAPIMEPSPSRRKLLNKRIEGDAELAELAEDEKELGPLIGAADEAAPPASAEVVETPVPPTPQPPVAAPSMDALFEETVESLRIEPRAVKAQALESVAAITPPAAMAALAPRACVSLELTAPEFLRLSIAAEALARPAQDIMAEALRLYLDAQGVERIDDLSRFVRGASKAG